MTKNINKIVYVGNFDPQSSGECEIASSFESLGYTVIRIREDSTTLAELEDVIENENPTFLLLAKFRVNASIDDKMAFLRKLKMPSVTWVFDLYFENNAHPQHK